MIDYTKFSPNGPVDATPIDHRWWTLSRKEIPQAVTAITNFLSQNDLRRQSQYQMSTKLYGNSVVAGKMQLNRDRVTYNVVQSVVDTIGSKMCKNKPKPLFLTSGGDWKVQRKAKKLDKFVEGIFYENKAHQLGATVFRDATVLGDGIIHVFEHYGRVKYERVLSSELFVDSVEAFYGEPRQMHRMKNVDRQVLIDLFPDKKREIALVDTAKADRGGASNIADQVTVIESWHLPSGPDAGDGLHTICIETEALLVEEWKRDHFPFAFLHWSRRMHGFWGQGLAEQLQPIQLEINKLLWVIQRSMHLAGSFKVLLENGSKIVKEHLNNDIGAIVTYNGTPPSYVTPPIVPLEYYQHLQNLKVMAFEQAGISMLSAASQKPAGLNSGKALREYNDIESDRFRLIGQDYENLFLDLAKLSVEAAKEIFERDGKYPVQVPGRKFIETIDWKDVDMDEDQYFMKIFPVSSLPSDPAGRLQTVQEYVQAGFLSPRAARRLLDFPDLEQIEDLQNATEDYLHFILGKLIEEGEYTPPEPFDDLNLAHELGLEYYEQGKLNGLEPEKLEMLRTFIDQVNLLKTKAQPPAQAGPAGGMANPMPSPKSDLLQNTPMGQAV
jgi:hypothetical protein